MKRRTLLKALLAWPLAGCGPSNKEKQVIQKLTENMQTHCIGRFLFELPKGFIQRPDAEVILYYGRDKDFTTVEVKVLDHGADQSTFEPYVKKRASEISRDTHEPTQSSMLVAQTEIGKVRLLRRYRSETTDDAFVSELYVLVDDLLIQAKEESFEGKFAPAEARLQKLATQLSKPQDGTKAGKGFCLGPLLIAADHDHEVVKFDYFSPELDAVWWQVYSEAITPDEEGGLLKRVDSKGELLKQAGPAPDLVRRGQIRLGGMKGEELLEKAKIYGVASQLFVAESMRPDPAFQRPGIQLTLKTGGLTSPREDLAKPSPWSTDEAVGIWDAVIKSVRLRPGAV
jgi:Tle cognate immunity protein 4 C-terminal domain/Tle cognate immunity protein 4 N-terminal domain